MDKNDNEPFLPFLTQQKEMLQGVIKMRGVWSSFVCRVAASSNNRVNLTAGSSAALRGKFIARSGYPWRYTQIAHKFRK
jgi:hypothetical protein